MRICNAIMIASICVVLAGCGGSAKEPALEIDRGKINAGLVNSYNDMAMQNAIISQHTLYPYHFVTNGAELNELGQRDLAVLAGHYKEKPGGLNVRRDDIPAELYGARVDYVVASLKTAGVTTERISISDGMPGGSGMTSEKVLTILSRYEKQENKKTTVGEYTTRGQ